MNTSKKTWDQWELLAIGYLQKNGYKILDTNFKFGRFGEIDLIAEKENLTVFIEVKYRNNTRFWTPEESLTRWKLWKCKKTVEYYCKKNRIDFESIRFDAITILKQESSHRLKHYRNIEI